ncbi:MAG: sugar isomerase [Planctomycetota bacterium]
MTDESLQSEPIRRTCCPCGGDHSNSGLTRRTFLQGAGGATLVGAALTGLTWSAVAMAEAKNEVAPKRRALVVKPVLVYSVPKPRPQSSWRNWGGIQTEADAKREVARIGEELDDLAKEADFPVKFLPISRVQNAAGLAGVGDLDQADVFLVYAAGGWMDTFDALEKKGKDIIIFCRHKSGPVYLWYEIISPRYLRKHTDAPVVKGVDDQDVVVDSQDEIMWRLRSLCGLRNTLGTKIIAVGGPGAWAQPRDVVPNLVKKIWQFDMQTFDYKELGELIKKARADKAAVERSKERAAKYLRGRGVKLETKREFVDNCFLLDQVFRGIMSKAGCGAITINGCMGTIIPISETCACLTLTLLNDAGYLAFCESDFVVIPSGVLLANISGKPVFLCNPTYPHGGIITIAHCTAPRRMSGKKLDKARIMTHYESDYGAAPKVEAPKGQLLTNIIPDFSSKGWSGLTSRVVENPFMDICRAQMEIRYECDDALLADKMHGFHWMTGYGDYLRELGYALKRVGIGWETLTA